MTLMEQDTQWRSSEVYTAINASKTGLLSETRQLLLLYARTHNFAVAHQNLVNEGLLQRSRETRKDILKIIQSRLTRWNPPSWVYDDLISFAQDTINPSLEVALLIHIVRQDALLYDFVQKDIVPRWFAGDHVLIRADVQRFLDREISEHPEIQGWSHATREKLAGNVLSILRDYTLLRGKEKKQIIEPIVPQNVAYHLIRLLRAEGVADEAIAEHPDWRIWLWDIQRVQETLKILEAQEASQ